MRRQPQFTPTSGAIAEENEDGASDGGGKKPKSATEMIARGLTAVEVEKRKLEDKLTEQKSSKLWIKRTLANLLLVTSSSTAALARALLNYCGDVSIHKLITLGLFVHSVRDKIKPILALMITKFTALAVGISIAKARDAIEHMRDTLKAIMAKIAESLVSLAAGNLALRISTATSSTHATTTDAPAREVSVPEETSTSTGEPTLMGLDCLGNAASASRKHGTQGHVRLGACAHGQRRLPRH